MLFSCPLITIANVRCPPKQNSPDTFLHASLRGKKGRGRIIIVAVPTADVDGGQPARRKERMLLEIVFRRSLELPFLTIFHALNAKSNYWERCSLLVAFGFVLASFRQLPFDAGILQRLSSYSLCDRNGNRVWSKIVSNWQNLDV